MYSREFSDKHRLPPHYGGTAFAEEERGCEEYPAPDPCEKAPPPPPPPSRGLLDGLLPFHLKGDDLLLLGLALLLLSEGCEDEVLPLLLLFLLIIH